MSDPCKTHAGTRDRTKDLQIFSLTLSQLSYHGHAARARHEAQMGTFASCVARRWLDQCPEIAVPGGGDLAQMVERSLSMREALGSMPRFSTFSGATIR